MEVAPAASQIILGHDQFWDFDAVFGPDVSQKELYSACLEDLVTSFYKGNSQCCIFVFLFTKMVYEGHHLLVRLKYATNGMSHNIFDYLIHYVEYFLFHQCILTIGWNADFFLFLLTYIVCDWQVSMLVWLVTVRASPVRRIQSVGQGFCGL